MKRIYIMDRIRHILYLLPLAVLLASCTQDEPADNGQGTPLAEPIPLQLTAVIGDGVATRATTVDGLWPEGGGTVYLQISETEEELDNAKVQEYTVDADGNLTPPEETETVYWTYNGQKFYICAWYPGGRTGYNSIPESGSTWTVEADQSDEENLAKDDFLYTYQTLNTGGTQVNFKHLMSKITVNVIATDYLTNNYEPDDVDVTLTSTSDSDMWLIEGQFSGSGSNFSLTGSTSAGMSSTITPYRLLSPAEDSFASFEAIVFPQYMTNKAIEVNVGGDARYKWDISVSGEDSFSGGYEYILNITLDAKGLSVITTIDTNITWSTGSTGTGSGIMP